MGTVADRRGKPIQWLAEGWMTSRGWKQGSGRCIAC